MDTFASYIMHTLRMRFDGKFKFHQNLITQFSDLMPVNISKYNYGTQVDGSASVCM